MSALYKGIGGDLGHMLVCLNFRIGSAAFDEKLTLQPLKSMFYM